MEERAQIQVLEKDEMLALLEIYWSELSRRRQILQNYAVIYITLLSAILAASVAGASLATTLRQSLFITAGPILAFAIAHFARDTVRRQDAHVREVIALVAKAENCLGLYGRVEVRGVEHKAILWPADESFMIDRWVKARTKSGQSSEDFITKKAGGTIRNLHWAFSLIQIISGLLFAGILMFPFIL